MQIKAWWGLRWESQKSRKQCGALPGSWAQTPHWGLRASVLLLVNSSEFYMCLGSEKMQQTCLSSHHITSHHMAAERCTISQASRLDAVFEKPGRTQVEHVVIQNQKFKIDLSRVVHAPVQPCSVCAVQCCAVAQRCLHTFLSKWPIKKWFNI